MTKHEMNLQPKFFDFIKNGTKRIELRLFDEKRQKIQINDIIEFSNPDGERVEAEVVALLRYKNFRDLFDDFDISILADDLMKKEELLEALAEFYSAEKQKEYGVLGIKIRLKSPVEVKNFSESLAEKFAIEKERLAKLEIGNIEHVGSSAVGIGGKNIIDILIGVDDDRVMKEVRQKLIGNGYFEGHDTYEDRIFLASSKDETTEGDFHIHICLKDSAEYENMIILRDFLLKNPEKAKEYEAKKRDFVELSNGERRKYKALKSEYVASLIKEAKRIINNSK